MKTHKTILITVGLLSISLTAIIYLPHNSNRLDEETLSDTKKNGGKEKNYSNHNLPKWTENTSLLTNKTHELFDHYIHRLQGKGLAGAMQIDEIRALQQPLTKNEINSLINIINIGNIPTDELTSLIRLLADQFIFGADPDEIRPSIRSLLLKTNDKIVGSATVLALSRIGEASDVDFIIKTGKARGFINDEEFNRELAHNFFRVSATTQSEWISILNSHKNQNARQIISDKLNSMEYLPSSNAVLIQLLKYLNSAEPIFQESSAGFGLFTAIDYQGWLKARARIISSIDHTDAESVISKTLLDESIDQRKVLAYLLKEENLNSITKKLSKEQRQHMADKLVKYSFENTNDFVVNAVQQVYPKLTE